MRILFLLFISFLFLQSKAQTDKIDNDADFIISKIRLVYPGLEEKKGEFEKIVKEINTGIIKDSFAILSKLTLPFDDNHLKLYQPIFSNTIDSNICNKNFASIKSKRHFSKYEGYWIDDLNTLIIYLKKTGVNDYQGYIVESKKSIPIGFCILKMKQVSNNHFISDIIDVNEWFRVIAKSYFKNDKVLLCNSFGKWKKINVYKKGLLDKTDNFDFNPSLTLLDSNNLLLRMPSFSRSNIKLYDSIIDTNKSIIGKTKNLIIDIRNNGGGVINNFLPLFPFICTNNIITPSTYRKASDDVINDTKKSLTKFIKSGDTTRSQIYKDYLTRLEGNKGGLIYNPSDTIATCSIDSFPNLINVAIITNNACLSAAELLLLYFKQSKKVKTFGEITGGAVDFLDTNRYPTPTLKYNLFVPTTKREITPKFPSYDKTGISPDVEISDDIEDWVQFVKKYYGKNDAK